MVLPPTQNEPSGAAGTAATPAVAASWVSQSTSTCMSTPTSNGAATNSPSVVKHSEGAGGLKCTD